MSNFPRPNEELPDLPPDRQKIIDDWWKQTAPLYRKRDADAMIQRAETALNELPDLFAHLGLHEEFLFELGGELRRRGRWPDYIALLKRVRSEQRRMYSFCYGAYDSDIIAEQVVAGHPEEISAYLDLFREYPDTEPDYCHQICNLLAWSGLAEPLYLLCEAVATPLLTSPDVVGGDFALNWLIRREEIPLYERGDNSSTAIEGVAEAVKALGERLQFPLSAKVSWLRAGLKACQEPPAVHTEAAWMGNRAQRHLDLHFVSRLFQDSNIPWVHGFFLGDLLLSYFDWCHREKLPWARLQRKDIEAFAVYRSRRLMGIDGVTLLAILQTIVWFAEYLGALGAFPPSEVDRVRADCGQLFELGRKAIDPVDPPYRMFPTFERLIWKSTTEAST